MTTADPTTFDEQAIGHIAVQLPGATAIFRRLKLDFCCGGQVALRDACAQKGLDADAVVSELMALQQRPQAPITPEPGELVDHILVRYHAVHREQLPELIRMARRVEAVHRDHPEVPTGLADFLETVEAELLEHMAKEENILFPLLQSGGHPRVSHPIAVMRHEHTCHGEQLERLAQFTHQHTPPVGACNTWRALYAGTAQLTEDLISHIHLENNMLFPPFEAVRAAG
jgi:regulator of cell morphogenesis and NO signaling